MGSKTSTQTSQQSTSPFALGNLQNIYNTVQGAASTPYSPYTGQLTAGVNGQQTAGINNINANANAAQPYFQQAANYAQAAGSPISASAIQAGMNPYIQNVVDATQAQFNKSNAEQQNQVKGNAAIAGALGGDRQAVAQSQLAAQQKTAQDPTIANLYSQGYGQALSAAQADRSAAGNAASLYGNIGTGAQNAALQGANAQIGAGTLQQQTSQAGLDAQYQQYLQQQAYPFATAQFLSQYGIPASIAQGSSSYGTQTQPGPNPFSQLLGLGTAAVTAYSDARVKENVQEVGQTHDGQPLYRFNYKGSPMTQIGLIAQEVEKSHPDAVGEEGGIKTVDYKKATDDAVGGFARGGSTPFQNFIQQGVSFIPNGGGIPSGNLNAPQLQFAKASGQDSSGDLGKMLGTAAKTFGTSSSTPDYGQDSNINIGGYSMPQFGKSVDIGGYRMPTVGFQDGGFVDAVNQIHESIRRARGGSVGSSPFASFANGGDADYTDPSWFNPDVGPGIDPSTVDTFGDANRAKGVDQLIMKTTEPVRLAGPEAMDRWRDGVDHPNAAIANDVDPVAPLSTMMASRSNPMTAALPRAITNPDNVPEQPQAALGYGGTSRSPFSSPAQPGGTTQPGGPSSQPANLPSAAPQSGGRFGSFNPFNLSDKAREAIIAGALGVAASRSPFVGTAIAEGALGGMGAYSSATKAEQEAAQKQSSIDQEAQRLLLQAQSYQETARHNKATEDREYKPTYGVIRQEIDPDTGTKRDIYGWIDPSSRKTTVDAGAPVPAKPAPLMDDKGNLITGEEYLKSLSPQRAALARKIGNYEVNPAGLSLRGGRREQAIADAARYNPDYDQRSFSSTSAAVKNFNAGAESRTIRSLNVAIDHLSTLDEAAKALQNGNLPLLNKVVNTVREKTGSPVTTNFDSIKQVVSAEIAKAVVGGQTALHDREDMAQRAANSQSPDQLSGIITQFKKLMAGQMNGLRHTYQTSTGLKDFDKYLEPQTRKELEAFSGKDAASTTGQPPTSDHSGWSFNAARQQYRDSSGRIYDKDGKPVTPD